MRYKAGARPLWAGIGNCFIFSEGDLPVNCLLLDRLFDSLRLLVAHGRQNHWRIPSFAPQSGHILALLAVSRRCSRQTRSDSSGRALRHFGQTAALSIGVWQSRQTQLARILFTSRSSIGRHCAAGVFCTYRQKSSSSIARTSGCARSSSPYANCLAS